MLQIPTPLAVWLLLAGLLLAVCWVVIPITARVIINGFFQEKFNFLNRISRLPSTPHRDQGSYRDDRIQ